MWPVTDIQQTTATVVTGASNSRLSGFTINKTTDNTNAIISVGTTSGLYKNLIVTGAGTTDQIGFLILGGTATITDVKIDNVNVAITTGGPGNPIITSADIGLTTQPALGVRHSGTSGTTSIYNSVISTTTDDILVTGNGGTIVSHSNSLQSSVNNIEDADSTLNDIGDYMSSPVFSVDHDSTVQEAAQYMRASNVGSLLVKKFS